MARRELSIAVTIAVVLIVLALVSPSFFAAENLRDVFLANVPVLIIAMGATLVILTGNIDISVGSSFAVCSVVAGVLAQAGAPVPVAALGAVIMALWLAYRPLQRHTGRRMFQAVAVFGLATVGFGLSTSLWLSLLCLFVLGAAYMISVFVRQTLVQIDTPDAMRGRVAAVNAVFIGASNELGEFESGVLAAWIGTVPAVVLGGLGTLAVAGLWARWFPELRRRDRLID